MTLLDITSPIMHDLFSNIHNHFHPRSKTLDGDDRTCRLQNLKLAFQRVTGTDYPALPRYRAETDVFGGPGLFARGESGTEVLHWLFVLVAYLAATISVLLTIISV